MGLQIDIANGGEAMFGEALASVTASNVLLTETYDYYIKTMCRQRNISCKYVYTNELNPTFVYGNLDLTDNWICDKLTFKRWVHDSEYRRTFKVYKIINLDRMNKIVIVKTEYETDFNTEYDIFNKDVICAYRYLIINPVECEYRKPESDNEVKEDQMYDSF